MIQGAFVLAKAKGGPEIAAECLDHLRRYLESQFHRSPNQGGMNHDQQTEDHF